MSWFTCQVLNRFYSTCKSFNNFFFILSLDKLPTLDYAIKEITSYLDFEDMKNAEEALPKWANIFRYYGIWGKLLQRNVTLMSWCFEY